MPIWAMIDTRTGPIIGFPPVRDYLLSHSVRPDNVLVASAFRSGLRARRSAKSANAPHLTYLSAPAWIGPSLRASAAPEPPHLC